MPSAPCPIGHLRSCSRCDVTDHDFIPREYDVELLLRPSPLDHHDQLQTRDDVDRLLSPSPLETTAAGAA